MIIVHGSFTATILKKKNRFSSLHHLAYQTFGECASIMLFTYSDVWPATLVTEKKMIFYEAFYSRSKEYLKITKIVMPVKTRQSAELVMTRHDTTQHSAA